MNVQKNKFLGELALYFNYKSNKYSQKIRYPRYLFCEVTNYCNLDCLQCARPSMKRSLGTMSYEVFIKIVDEVGPHVDIFDLNMWGEPLINPHIFDMIEYAKKNGVKLLQMNHSTYVHNYSQYND